MPITANAQADQSNLNQIGADLVDRPGDVIVAVAIPFTAPTTMLAAVEDTDIPVVTLSSPTLNIDTIWASAVRPEPGCLHPGHLADAKAFCDSKGHQVH